MAFFVVPNVLGSESDKQAPKEEAVSSEEQEQSEKTDEAEDDSADGEKLNKDRYESFTVSDVKVITEDTKTPKITCTVTNNTDLIAVNVGYSVEGEYTFLDDYSDEETGSDSIYMLCTQSGKNSIPYLFPGENEIELVPTDKNNVVITYRSSYSGEE